MTYDIAIIGAGVIGGMVARELSRYHLSVCLLEKENDVAMGASRANSGIIHGGYDPEPGTLKAELNTKGIGLLYNVAKELNVHYRNNGSLVCAFGTEEEETQIEELYQRSLKNGIDGVKIISGAEARQLEPQLSEKVSLALHVPNAGIICPYELTIAAIGNAMDNGVELLRNFEVKRIEKEDEFFVYAKDGKKISCKYLINCAGCYADKISEMLGDTSFCIIPRAGEYMLLDKTEGNLVSHTIFQVPSKEGKGILVTPTVDGNLLIGPTAVEVSGVEHTEVTTSGLQTVKEVALKSIPGINMRQVITSFAGVRSSEQKGDFIIQASDEVENYIIAGAIDSPGLTASVAIAKRVVELCKTQGLVLEEKSDWNGTRESVRTFQELSYEEKDTFIKKNPEYGKIVCRCEGISAGEIRAAIRQNPSATDIDGIKRRTRSGMGRCQGGFCLPQVMKILSEELEIPMEDVTKSGTGSGYITGRL